MLNYLPELGPCFPRLGFALHVHAGGVTLKRFMNSRKIRFSRAPRGFGGILLLWKLIPSSPARLVASTQHVCIPTELDYRVVAPRTPKHVPTDVPCRRGCSRPLCETIPYLVPPS